MAPPQIYGNRQILPPITTIFNEEFLKREITVFRRNYLTARKQLSTKTLMIENLKSNNTQKKKGKERKRNNLSKYSSQDTNTNKYFVYFIYVNFSAWDLYIVEPCT